MDARNQFYQFAYGLISTLEQQPGSALKARCPCAPGLCSVGVLCWGALLGDKYSFLERLAAVQRSESALRPPAALCYASACQSSTGQRPAALPAAPVMEDLLPPTRCCHAGRAVLAVLCAWPGCSGLGGRRPRPVWRTAGRCSHAVCEAECCSGAPAVRPAGQQLRASGPQGGGRPRPRLPPDLGGRPAWDWVSAGGGKKTGA